MALVPFNFRLFFDDFRYFQVSLNRLAAYFEHEEIEGDDNCFTISVSQWRGFIEDVDRVRHHLNGGNFGIDRLACDRDSRELLGIIWSELDGIYDLVVSDPSFSEQKQWSYVIRNAVGKFSYWIDTLKTHFDSISSDDGGQGVSLVERSTYNSFVSRGQCCVVRYKGIDWPFVKSCAGAERVREIFQRRKVGLTEFSDFHKSTIAVPASALKDSISEGFQGIGFDETGQEEKAESLRKLRDKISETRDYITSLPPEEVADREEQEAELAKLTEQLHKDTGLGGKPRPDKTGREKELEKIKKSINRFLKEAKEHIPQFTKHYGESATYDEISDSFVYSPSKDPAWDFLNL